MEPMEKIYLDRDEIAVDQGDKKFWLRPSGDVPNLNDLDSAILVTRLRWWADKIETRAYEKKLGLDSQRATQ